MGLIKAFTGAVSSTFADQWLDFYEPTPNVPATAAMFPAVKNQQNNGNGSNTKGSENVITNGSKIIVPEGMGLVLMQDGGITGVITDAGGYEYRSEDTNAQSVFAGDGIIGPLVKQSWERFKFGGVPGANQTAFYVNLKEIVGNKFGTPSPIHFFDNYIGAQIGLMARGSYSIRIVDPILFIKQFVPSDVITGNGIYDFADYNNAGSQQLFDEFIDTLDAGFASYTLSPDYDGNINSLKSDRAGISTAFATELENKYSWKTNRGIQLGVVAFQSLEYDEESMKILNEMRGLDALNKNGRADVLMKKSVAAGIQAAGENGGGTGMAFMGMGMNAAGGMMNAFGPQQNQQPVQQPVQGVVAGDAVPAEDPYAKLEKLKGLLDNNIITQEDFDKEKAEILGKI